MRITEVKLQGPHLPETLELSQSTETENSSNWINVLSGENGTRKSLLLRLITLSSLNYSTVHNKRDNAARAVLTTTAPIHKVIAVSGTHSDRFPQAAGTPISRPLSGFDIDEYSYFGPKYAGNIAGRHRIASNLLISILSNPIKKVERKNSILAVLQRLGYSETLNVKLRLRLSKFGVSSAKSQLERVKKFLSSSKSPTAKNLLKFASDLLEHENLADAIYNQIPDRKLNFTLKLTKANNIEKFKTLIPYLSTGLIDIDDILFERTNQGTSTKPRTISIEELSSGQIQLLNNLLNLALNIQNETLILIDEPENSLHPEWQRDYINLLRESTSCASGCHIIIATHSPLVASGVRPGEGSLLSLKRDPDTDDLIVSQSGTVHGWLPGAVLEERFDMESVRAPELSLAVSKALNLLKTGQTDQEQLQLICRDIKNLLAELPPDDTIIPALEAIIELGNEASGS